MLETRFDTLGMAVGNTIMGKPGEEVNDTVDNFEQEMAEDMTVHFFANLTELGLAASVLREVSS